MGGVYTHCIGHTGDYYPDGFLPGAISSGGFTVSHTWVDGFLLHHFLTGDLRSLETAREWSRIRYDGHGTRSYDFGNCRDSGWHLVHAMAMYHATLDRFYLNASHIIVERVLERQTEDGGWRRMLIPGHCFCSPPRHTGNAGFMVGILLNGLKLYHQATGDPRVADAIVRGAEFLIDDMWVDDANGFLYTSCPHSQLSTDNFHRGIDGIAYAWRISRSPRFEPVLRRATQEAIDTESFGKAGDEGSPLGKAISAGLRSSPYVLYDVARLPDSAQDLNPRPPTRPERPRQVDALSRSSSAPFYPLRVIPQHDAAGVTFSTKGVHCLRHDLVLAGLQSPGKAGPSLPPGFFTQPH